MLSKKIESALNKQIEMEAYASYYYLSMASWCDKNGLPGAAKFLYGHSNEEREHMLKLFHYINEAGGHAITPAVKQPGKEYKSVTAIIQSVLNHEIMVTKAINGLVELCLKEKDYSTFNFLQWYVAEQHEEETLFRTVLDKISIIGDDKKGLFWIDKEIGSMAVAK